MAENVREYDVIVVGSGSGATIVENALDHELTVALIDHGPLGGTCLNVGCIPSKILIYPADQVMAIREAATLGIHAQITEVAFGGIMERMRRIVDHDVQQIREGIRSTAELDYYDATAHFVGEHTLQVGDTTLRGERIYLASGSRPQTAPIEGLDEVAYLTNESVLALTERPESLLIVGGGYIGAEYAHFFEAMGTKVTLVQRNERLVPEEEPEISELLKEQLRERMTVATGTEIVAVQRTEHGVQATGNTVEGGAERSFAAKRIMIATGRRSNADLLQVERGGIETDERGYIRVDPYLETTSKGVWAVGDANGRHMFTHVANREVLIAWHNSVHDHRVEMDYSAIPHAVFTHPQIASVGLTEAQAKQEHEILIGEAMYLDVAKGQAMMDRDSFAKAILDRESYRILGFHVIGPYAPIVIQEVIDAMANQGTIEMVSSGLHIHPALPEVVVRTLYQVREPL